MDRAFRAIRRADVVGLVIDAVDGVTQQDFRCLAPMLLVHAQAVSSFFKQALLCCDVCGHSVGTFCSCFCSIAWMVCKAML